MRASVGSVRLDDDANALLEPVEVPGWLTMPPAGAVADGGTATRADADSDTT